MKGKKILYIVSIILCLILLAYVAYPALTDGIDSVNTKQLLKGLLALGALVAGFLKIWGRDSRPGGNRAHYERVFAERIGRAFSDDKRNYDKLIDAIMYFGDSRYSKAIKILDTLYKKACRSNADYEAVMLFLGICYSDSGNYHEAIEIYEALLNRFPYNVTALSNLGLLYKDRGDYDRAIKLFENAISVDSSYVYADNNLAGAYYRKGEYEEALKYVDKTIELKPGLESAYGYAALCHKALGHTDEAEKYCRLYAVNGGDGKALANLLSTI